MLKNLKKKDTKAEPKKDTKKEKQPKNDTKKQKEDEEEETNDALVELNYDQKDSSNVKNTKKVQSYKLQEKQIDTANIVIEKKEEKKQITSWIVDEKDIKNVFKTDFDAKKMETEFESLTDQKLNKELEEKAKKEAEVKPTVEEKGGFKFAVLQTDKSKNVEPELALRKPGETASIQITPQIGGVTINPPQFINSNKTNFVPLEKTPQQLREEELERKMQQQQVKLPESSAKGKVGGWLGSKQPETKPQAPQEFKVSAWAAKAEQFVGPKVQINTAAKFAPLQKSQQEKRFQRQQQEFKFVSKKQQEQRRLKREEQAKKGVTATTTTTKQ